jgi:hypothetical protein
MTGRESDVGHALRSLLLKEANAMPVDTQHAAEGLRRRIVHTRKRRRVTLAVAASVVVAAVAVTVAGGWLGVNKVGGPAQSPDPSVAVAREFLDAYGSFDADTAINYLSDDAIAQGWDTPEGLRLELAHYRAQGYEQTIHDCRQVGNSEPAVSFLCDFDMHAIRSDEIGLGPYSDNNWHLTVHDGKVVSAKQIITYPSNGFSSQMWEPFAAWVSHEYPNDVLVMYTDEGQTMQRVTEDSNRLWEQRTAEYVAAVKQNPAAHLDQPAVAAYVAQLESICSAAQARLNDELQAIPDPPNQPASIEAHERIMRETIPELRAVPLPPAIRWPYLGRAFPLMEAFSQYGTSVRRVPPDERRPETLLLSRIQLIPGLDKC